MNVHFDGLRHEGLAHITQVEAEKLKNVTVQEGDVLLNITGASIGRVTTAPGELAGARVNQHVCIIRPSSALLPKFLTYFLATPVEQMRINECQVGATRQALTKKMIEDWQVPLPPLEEQQQIVAEIEKQFTRLEVGLAALGRVQANLKRYRAAVLKAACEGRLVPTEAELARAEVRSFESGQQLLARILTERRQKWKSQKKYMEPEPAASHKSDTLPKGWCWATFEQVSERVTVGFVGSMSHEYVSEGIPFLRGQNVRENRFDPEGLLFIRPEFHAKLAKSAIRPGDLAVIRSGAVGVTCVIPETLPEANCSDLVLVQRPIGLVPNYGAYFMNSLAKRHVEQGKVGIALTHFNTKSVAALSVPLPPLAEQMRIVAEAERRLSVVKELEAVVTVNLRRGGRLRGSILASGLRSDSMFDQGLKGTKQINVALFNQGQNSAKETKVHTFSMPGSNFVKVSPMKKQTKLTPQNLVEAVRRNKGSMTPTDLCLASNVEDDVEAFFEVLRECRDQGLLMVPSGIGAIIKLAKS